MLERAKNFILYGGADRESYQAIKGKIEANNRITSLVIGTVAAFLIAVMLLLSYYQETFSSSRPVYIAGVVLFLAIALVSLVSRRWPMLTYVAVYLAVSVALIYGIAIATLTRPEEQTVTFMVLLIFVPLIFVDRPIRMAAALVLFDAAFIVIACQAKAPHVLAADVTDAVIYGLLALVSEALVNRAKIRGFVLESRLHAMSMTDQLTGLNNRNRYELNLGRYPGRAKESICCVYLDGDGLHELNNREGHREGDRMLCSVAGAIRDAFGADDTYRIGGDEFVAFALDCPREEAERRIEDVRVAVEEAGYRVSAGHEYANIGDMAFDELIGRAEANMYSEKTDHYGGRDRAR